jgi:3-hydroxyacyl-CoA dehydrogenase/enoyl-CoA hydratase/3-hydroxybutyryl-CoA epimerase
LIDEVGIDVGCHVLETMAQAFPDRIKMPDVFDKVMKSGRLGRKNSKGFYLYEDGRKGGVDRSILELLPIQKKSTLTGEEITDRCLLVFINETIRCLDDGILLSCTDGDIGAVFGLGFPPFWGGPFKYVDMIGAKEILEKMRSLEKRFGARFLPAKSLVRAAEENLLFFPKETVKNQL